MTPRLKTAAFSVNPTNKINRSGDLVLLIVLMVSFDWLLNHSGKCIFVDFNSDVDCPLNVTSIWNFLAVILESAEASSFNSVTQPMIQKLCSFQIIREFSIQVKFACYNKCKQWQIDSLVKFILTGDFRDLEASTKQRNVFVPWANLSLFLSHLYQGISYCPFTFCAPKYMLDFTGC